MFLILLFTILGFLVGLSFVMVKRKIRPGSILTATFLGLLAAGAWKVFKDYSKTKGRRKYF
jgi:4-amino-4-deoxy-L-arabinose transferase-like glycosyltransferase